MLTGCVAAACVAACEPADRLRTGMPERDVLRIMGPPSRTVEDVDVDAAMFREELPGEPACRAGARRILVYNVTPRRRVRVVLDADARVTCVVKTEDLMH